MNVAAINAFIRTNSRYGIISPTKGKSPVVALIGVRDMERKQQHVAAVSIIGLDMLRARDQRDLLLVRIREAEASLDRHIASL